MLTSLCEFLNNCFEWFSLDDNFSAVVDVTRSALLLDEWLFCDAYLRRSVLFFRAGVQPILNPCAEAFL